MRLLVTSTLILLALCWTASAQSGATAAAKAQATATGEAEWERYTYPGEEFSVLLPEMPSLFHTIRSIKGSDDTERARMYGAYQDGTVFIITAYDKPRKNETLDYFFSKLNGGYKSLSGEAQDINLGGFPGKQYSYKYANYGTTGVMLVLLTKKHAYFISSYSDRADNSSMRRFIDSFTIAAKPIGKTITGFTEPLKITYAPPIDTSVLSSPSNTSLATPTQPVAPNASPQANAQTTTTPDGPFTAKMHTRKAIIYSRPGPGYTEEARRNNVTGLVKLRVVLSSSGRVTNITVVKTLPDGLTEKAVDAARHIVFIPAAKDNRHVSQYVSLEYNFNIY